MLSSVDADYCLGRWAGLPPHLDALDGLPACGWLVRLVYNPQRPIDFEKGYVCQEEIFRDGVIIAAIVPQGRRAWVLGCCLRCGI